MHYSISKNELLIDLAEASLIEHSLKQNPNNQLSASGALVIKTGKFTGRAADDKYVVEDNYSNKTIDWKNNIKKMHPDTFKSIKEEIIHKFETVENLIFITNRSASADALYALGVTLITPSAAHALFAKNIFRDPQTETPLGNFTIYHDPDFKLDNNKYSLKSQTVISINFTTQEIIIIGTGYAGEIKKSIFSVLNTLLPDLGVLPMHTGANQDSSGKTSLFFGLSGTGKTTLSTDQGVHIIGDDEHGLSKTGIFNFEGGCYAKTDGLKKEKEPDIFKASNQFGSLLENVMLDPKTRVPLFDDKTITENGRATYSLKTLENIVHSSCGAIPTNIFFLSADAMGVLPAISKLTPEQAMFYFLTGYTAKLAGTELGLKGVKAAFSHCFGAPFMMRKSSDYGELLKKFLTDYSIQVWLVNTGWYGGVYGEGKRYPLEVTRNCIRAIQNGMYDADLFEFNEVFSLQIPLKLEGVDPLFLDPKSLWSDKENYNKKALELRFMFEENYKNFN